MSAVPRWSHRDPVEGGNPFPDGDPRCRQWKEATARALAALRRYDADLAASRVVADEPDNYARRWLDLATMRFDTWARRGLAGVNSQAAEHDYAMWLRTCVTNWRTYVGDTCPHVGAEVRDRLAAHLAARARYWTDEARRLVSSVRGAPAAAARPDPRP
jgi:hypothetical protein